MSVRMYINPARKAAGEGTDLSPLSVEKAQKVRYFHNTFHEYAPTPLTRLPGLARALGLGSILIKDESFRFGLNAFKVLGGSYAIGHFLADRLGRDIDTLSCEELCSPAVRKKTGNITFISTTDGNHGRGVAWTAHQLGQKAIIYMPKGSAQSRVDNIRSLGAECRVTELNYDDTVRLSWQRAQQENYVMVQDTAWDGYETIPTWIMQGYMTLALEALEQMRGMDVLPTHVFLQAGVGSFAGSIAGFLISALGEKAPKIIIVEPHKANCIYTSAVARDAKPHSVKGALDTLMAGLACGEANTVSWGILRDYATAYISCPDFIAANGMRILGAPCKGDPQIISGESGAVTTGILQWLMQHPAAQTQRDAIGLNGDSTALLISTEGDTSPIIYRNIVWFGACAAEDILA